MLVILRSLEGEGVTKYDYYLSNSPSNTPLKDFVRAALAEDRFEEAPSNAARAKPGCRTMKFATGQVGITIKFFR